MTVIINGTNGITSVNGTAAAPSVTGTDTDTGIVYGTNTVTIATGGTAGLIQDASQNIGVGGLTPFANTIGKSIDWVGGAGVFGYSNIMYQSGNAYFESGSWKYKATGVAGMKETSNSHKMLSASSGSAGATITFTTVMDIAKDQTLALQGATSVSGTGISFPATQSASTDANTLDDYEEGTWTPTISFGGTSTGVVYGSTNAGFYTKVGRLVTVTFMLDVSNRGSSTGSAVIGGLPFTCANTQGNRGGVAIGYTSGLSVNNPNLMADAGSTQMTYRNPNAADMSQSNFTAPFSTYATYSYFV